MLEGETSSALKFADEPEHPSYLDESMKAIFAYSIHVVRILVGWLAK